MLGILDVVMEVVNRVICRADTLHVIVFHQTTGGELRLLQFLVTLIENLTSGLRREQFLDAEGSLQLQMCPVIQRVAECIRHRLSPFLEFLPVAGVLTGAIFLINTIGTHGTPFVVVATQPKLCDALEAVIVSHHLESR